MDIDAAVRHLDRNAGYAPNYQCATYVRLALLAGGLAIEPHPVFAKDYGPYLIKAHFKRVAATDYVPVKGDIVVIQPYSRHDRAGHIAMYDGKQWVSEFRQHDIWPGPGYRIHRPHLQVYRL